MVDDESERDLFTRVDAGGGILSGNHTLNVAASGPIENSSHLQHAGQPLPKEYAAFHNEKSTTN